MVDAYVGVALPEEEPCGYIRVCDLVQKHIPLQHEIGAVGRGKRRVEPVHTLDDAVGVSPADHVLVGEVVRVRGRVEHEHVIWNLVSRCDLRE